MIIDREALIARLEPEYPHAARETRACGAHLGMASLSHDTQDAIDRGDWEQVRVHFDFVNEIFLHADDYVRNAIYVSYIEHITLHSQTDNYRLARSLLPERLKRAALQLDAHFKWLSNERRSRYANANAC